MANLLMAEKCRSAKFRVGPGGRYCACCDVPPRTNKKVRRSVKRSERNSWKKEVS